MKFEIKHRFTGEVLFAVEGEDWRFAVEAAAKAKANLSWADLSGANLSRANLSGTNLSGTNLSGADLSGANLSRANLSGTDLSGTDLSGADLSRANLSWANLSRADLSRANLSVIKNDVWAILLFAVPEIPALKQALKDGKVNGSVYEGECACLCGTIANARKCSYTELAGIKPDNSRPAERFFMGIKPGDTPESNGAAREAMKWIEEFEEAIKVIKNLPTA